MNDLVKQTLYSVHTHWNCSCSAACTRVNFQQLPFIVSYPDPFIPSFPLLQFHFTSFLFRTFPSWQLSISISLISVPSEAAAVSCSLRARFNGHLACQCSSANHLSFIVQSGCHIVCISHESRITSKTFFCNYMVWR